MSNAYEKMDFGFNGCEVKWGPLQSGVSEADMVRLATETNAAGFTYQPSLKYGHVLVGAYPKECKSSANESWPLYLLKARSSDDGTFAIASVAFPGVYLRLDGTDVTQPSDYGGGTVNCQFGAHPWEKFRLEEQEDGTFAIASVAFPGVYLRLDGTDVTQPSDYGGGTVNCQFGAHPWEKFRLEEQEDGTFAIASVAFPGVYLRLDGTDVTKPSDYGGGTVNCQFGAHPWEKFRLEKQD